MPSDDKKGLPSIFPSRRDVLKGVGSSVIPSLAHPLVEAGMERVLSGPTSTVSSIADKLPMTRNLLKEYWKLEDKSSKLLYNLKKNSEHILKYEEDAADHYADVEEVLPPGQNIYRFYMTMEEDMVKKLQLTKYLEILKTIPKSNSIDQEINVREKELESTEDRINDSFHMLEDNNKLLNVSKEQKESVLEIFSIRSQLNKIQSIAKKERLPFNYYNDKLKELEDYYYNNWDPIDSDTLRDKGLNTILTTDGVPTWKVLSDMRKDNMDDIFKDKNNLAELESMHEEYLLTDTPEYENIVRTELTTFEKNELIEDLDPDRSKLLDILENSKLSEKQKDKFIDELISNNISNRKEKLATALFSDSLPDDKLIKDPDEKQKVFTLFKNELANVSKIIAKNIAKDIASEEVTKKFVTKGGWKGQEYKAGPWSQKIYDYIKSLKTPKAPSGPTIESDKIRAEKAKVIEEVKTETKKEPSRNWKNDLSRLMRKGSPLFSLLALSGDAPQNQLRQGLPGWSLADLEYQIEQDPKADEIKKVITKARQEDNIINKEDRGRMNKNPYDNYNTQRAI